MIPGLDIVAALLTGVVLLPWGQTPPKDACGDEIPAGAVTRLGTIRYRHADWVTAVATSPDGEVLASGGADGSVHLWNFKTGKRLRTWVPGSGKEILASVEFSADGKLLAAAAEASVWVWSTSSGEEVRHLRAAGSGFALSISPDGQELAGQNSEGSVFRWDLATGKEAGTLEGFSPTGSPVIPCLSFSPDGAHLAVGGAKEVRLFARASGKEVRRFKGHEDLVTSLVFSKDGKLLVTVSHDGSVRLWESASGEEIHALPGPKFQSPTPRELSVSRDLATACLALASDGKTLAVGGGGKAASAASVAFPRSSSPADREIHLWNLDTGREVGVLRNGDPSFIAFRFSPDGKTLVAASGNSVQLWDMASGKEVPGPAGPRTSVRALAFSPDGTLLAAEAQGDAFLRVWDVATAKEQAPLPMERPGALPSTLMFSPDGKIVTRTSAPFLFWDFPARKQLSIHSRTDPSDWSGGSVAFFPDGNSFLAPSDLSGSLGKIRQREVLTGKRVRSVSGKEAVPNSLAVSPDGKFFAAGYWDGSVWVWDAATGQKVWSGQIPADPATRAQIERFGKDPSVLQSIAPRSCVSFGSGARTITGLWGASVTVWSTATGRVVQECEGGWGGASALTLSPDGKTLAGWKEDEVHLWELAGGEQYLKIPASRPSRVHFSGYENGVGCFAFSPDGRTLAVVSDLTILVWDLLRAGLGTEPADPDGLLKACAGLRSKDAREARSAMESLVRAGDRSVEALSRVLTPSAPLKNDEVNDLAAALASDDIARRDAASSALQERGSEGQLEGLLEGKHPEETIQRIRQILGVWNRPVPQTAPELGVSRAIEVLERIGTAKAAEALDTLVASARLNRQQEDARLALARLTSRARNR